MAYYVQSICEQPDSRMEMKNQKIEPKVIIGWREWITLPDLGVPAIKAKIDTGARTSAIHVIDLQAFEINGQQMVRFKINPLQKNKAVIRFCEAPVLERCKVKNSGGRSEIRYVIQTRACISELIWPINITLTNRDLMTFRMLLGRKALENGFLINPGRSFLTGRSLAKSYQNELSR
jgi:hypothetical protein